MKIRSVGSCLLLASLLLGGCAFMNEEDRDFYGKGWIRPTDLDKPDSHHYYAEPGGVPQAAPATRPVSRDPDPEWITPETSDRSQ